MTWQDGFESTVSNQLLQQLQVVHRSGSHVHIPHIVAIVYFQLYPKSWAARE